MTAPVKPQDKSFRDLLSVLEKHFDPKPLVIGERFHFYKRSQHPSESMAQFQADLRKLSIRCEFGTFLDQAIRDRFVCGVRNEAIQKKLLTAEDGLTAAKALEIAQGIEAADKNARELKGQSVASPGGESLHFAGAAADMKSCYRCGRHHDARSCKFRDATCHKCGKCGHIAPVCRSVGNTSDKEGPPTKSIQPKRRYPNRGLSG